MIVFLDTNVVIYAVESEPTFGLRAQTRIASALAAGSTLMISDLVRMECTGPARPRWRYRPSETVSDLFRPFRG